MSLELHQYVVFSPEVDGGKRFALVDSSVSLEAMPEIARLSGAPLTAFITGFTDARAQVRFFSSAGREKLESDSGALVVAHHLGSSCTVVMPGGALPVLLEDGLCWTTQGDHHLWPLEVPESDWLDTLGLTSSNLDGFHKMGAAGNDEKQNVIVPVRFDALDGMTPNLERVAELNATSGTNGLIVVAFDSPRANMDFRFFAPRKGILEDNAGSFSLASLCGFRAMYTASGRYEWTAAQGYAMGKPSSLTARLIVRDSVAMAVQVGGRVARVQSEVHP